MALETEEKVVLPGLSRKQMIGGAVFLIAMIAFLSVLWRGLNSDPNKVPSALIDKEALGFEVKWLQGQEHMKAPRAEGFSLADFKGRPMILNFWASWCYSCQSEASDFEAFWQRYKDKGIVVAGIAIQDTPEAALGFAKKYGKTYILGLDAEDGKAAIDYGVTGVPETFFIDKEGRVVHKEAGPVSTELLAKYAEILLK